VHKTIVQDAELLAAGIAKQEVAGQVVYSIEAGEAGRALIGQYGDTVHALARQMNDAIAGFVRGQTAVCLILGSFYAVSGLFDLRAVAASIPVGLLVAAILHGNEWRDISEDARAGAKTFSVQAGRAAAHWLYVALVVGAYLALSAAVVAGLLPTWTLLAMLSLPLLVRQIRSSELGATGQQRAIAMIDLETAQLHAVFGYLLVVGLVIAALLAR